MKSTEQLLKSLTEAHGIPGYEAPVREITRKYFEPLGELITDRSGSLICKKTGNPNGPKVMLAGHLDEIGFMVKNITDDGFLKFLPLGGWFDQVMLGHRVIVKTHKGDLLGVIGAKPPHLLEAEERSKLVTKKDMYIDLGVSSKEEAEELGARAGDPVIPASTFEILANGKTFVAKAFDDRVGVAVMIEALQALQTEDHPNTVFAAATVQEEVGLRGARTSAWVIDPDVAIILESDIAGDVPGITADQSSAKLGDGPTVIIYDRSMIPNIKMRDFVIETAASLDIPVQLTFMEGGGTDGGVVHVHKYGVPTIAIGVPARHIHSHNSIIHRDDYENMVILVKHLLLRLDNQTVADFIQ